MTNNISQYIFVIKYNAKKKIIWKNVIYHINMSISNVRVMNKMNKSTPK